MKIGLDYGHCLSGFDTGASGCGYREENLTREIGKILKFKLEQLGHIVIEVACDHSNSLNESLSYRVNIANTNKVDLYVSIHLNATMGGYGVETYVSKNASQSSKNYAQMVQTELVTLGYRDRGVKSASLYVLNNTTMPSILCECGFIDSPVDMKIYNAEKIANSLCKGITGQVPSVKPNANILYSSHIELDGWQGVVKNGQTSGTIGKAKRLEAISIDYDGDGYLEFECHISNRGWQGKRFQGDIGGTMGKSEQIEAICISLKDTNNKATYRSHIQDLGWQPWVGDGEISGTVGQSKRIEAIEIKIL